MKPAPPIAKNKEVPDVVAARLSPAQALRLESDRALTDLIRYRLSLPPDKRLNVLRRKIGLRATCL